MNTYWKIETHGDPLGALHGFIQSVWRQARLDGLLVPANGDGKPRLLDDPAAVQKLNPFRPVMHENLARHVPRITRAHPDQRIGVLLRPCEMRALIEMSKRKAFPRDRLVTLCFDCLGTYPLEEYEWRTHKKGASSDLADETLQFARQGGILAYRYRAACQICTSPAARSADINVHVLGLPVRQQILVETLNEQTVENLQFQRCVDGLAEAAQVEQHQHLVTRQEQRHAQTMERLIQTLDELLPRDVERLVDQLESCGDCQTCMSTCPICAAEFPRRGADGHYPPQAIRRWLVSCAGCGMCEQACNSNLPLGVIFVSIRQKLDQELAYTPGLDWAQPLPF